MSREGLPNLRRDEVLARLAEAGYPESALLAPLLQWSIWLRPDPTRTPGLLESRFGGPAMVPPEFEWPCYNADPYLGDEAGQDGSSVAGDGEGTAAPLCMIAQINLTEVPRPTALPPAGLLSFFVDPFDGVWGHERSDRSGFQVTYTPADELAHLRPREMPHTESADEPWPHLAMTFFQKWTLADGHPLAAWAEDRHDREPWSDVPDQVTEAWSEITGYNFGHFLLDGGRNHQGDPRESAVLLFDRPDDPNDGSTHEAFREHQAEIERRARDWVTLFSITKDRCLRPLASDTGGLSFVVRKDDLAVLRFDRAWIVRS